MKIWGKFGWGVILLLMGGCFSSKQENNRIESALQASGSNRVELEKVLKHYSEDPKDSLKLKAAVFLIENMPGHWGPDSSSIAGYRARIDTMSEISTEERKILLELPSRYPESCPTLKKTEDIHILKARDLIGYIDEKFRQKENSPWLKDQNFDIFCEYLLPYRIGNEWVEFSPDTLPTPLTETIAYMTENYHDFRHSLYSMASYIQRRKIFRIQPETKDSLLKEIIVNPEYEKKILLVRYRRMGIPVALDYAPIHRSYEKNNYWIVPIDSRLTARTSPPTGALTGKIYRHTFSANPRPVTDSSEYVPPFFRNPFLKDVTDLYLHTVDLSLCLKLPDDLHYAYLAMHDGKEWQPVAYGKNEKSRCVFKKLGKNCIYLPVCYPDGKMQPLAPPFLLRSTGETLSLNGSADSVVTLQMERICPYTSKSTSRSEVLQKVQFTCADNENFENPDTACGIKEKPHYKLYSVRPEKKLKKRFWRLETPRGHCVLSELHFLDSTGQQPKGQYIIRNIKHIAALTDNDPLTSKAIIDELTIDFGKPVKVSEIRYMNRNDGYNIWPGNEYELSYYRNGEWLPIEKKRAEDQTISFERVPANELYRLRNTTHEINGTVFTWEKGRARFW